MNRFLSKSKSMETGSRRSTEIGPGLPPLDVNLSESALKEAAYEIILVASGSIAARALVYTGIKKSTSLNKPAEKSATAMAASRMKKALGLRSKRDSDSQGKAKQPIERLRIQLGVSEKVDARVRRALTRATAGQTGKSLVVPVELLQNIGSTDFFESEEYNQWRSSQLDVLEAGLLCHPKIDLDKREIGAQRLKQVLFEARQTPFETGRNSERMQALRSAAMALASRGDDGIHWADGYPFNVHLYQVLLQCCFDTQDPSAVIDEMDELVDLLKNGWSILGIDQKVHNICFLWVLFRQFFVTGETELELLGAAQTQLNEVSKDAKNERDPIYIQLLSSALSGMQQSVEKRLFSYHDAFPVGGAGLMDKLIPYALAAAQILHEDISQEYRRRRTEQVNVAATRIDAYIRSSVRSAFAMMMEPVDSKRKLAKTQTPALAVLAKDTMDLLRNEKAKYSPIFSQWHPNPGGVAAATLHACYHRELKQYLTGLKILTPESVEVLKSADQLEKELVQAVVEDAVDCDDGGKGLIREMPPFEGDSTVAALTKQWVQSSIERLGEWAERNMAKEDWNPNAMREHYAPSVVELLRLIEETLDAFYVLPISPPKDVVQDLASGVDRVLYRYVAHAVSNCESKTNPRLPPLTRWNKDLHAKSSLSWFKKDKRKGQVEPRNGVQHVDTTELQHLCVRINTLYHLESELEFMDKRIRAGWQDNSVKRDSEPQSKKQPGKSPDASGDQAKFERARSSCKEGIQKLTEAGVHRAVFQDMRAVLWDGLYAGGVANARVDQVIHQLDAQLEVIASTVSGRLRNKLVTALMRCCFDAFSLVILGGGPSRAFQAADAAMLEEDLAALRELFKADGDGLPAEVVDRYSSCAAQVLPLFAMETGELIDRLKSLDGGGRSRGSSSAPVPPNPKSWSPSDPNTVLRVLCHRADETASKFLKKAYGLPKRV
ncbi:uncharacterized protein LOC9656156 [Selaginella moellendorffii]|uniref:uncharacterized protein LOC9656156 n=1 Tax=Selaginella moellendorffii TaxID=88036 RepID=UPI000D1C7794|nr:uncharacterized protein LOC9656156 [Selaginella moellendorffii]|eukprot:XP_024538315.1 uncharacterized protein LOC9656156 [Selaginella moellendorffii]